MLSNRIKQFRTFNKIEATSITEFLGVDLEEYLKYESGEKLPNIDVLTTLAKIYKITVNELYGNSPRLVELQNNEFISPSKKDELDALKFSELSIDEKELILAYRTANNKEQFFKIIEDNKKQKSD